MHELPAILLTISFILLWFISVGINSYLKGKEGTSRNFPCIFEVPNDSLVETCHSPFSLANISPVFETHRFEVVAVNLCIVITDGLLLGRNLNVHNLRSRSMPHYGIAFSEKLTEALIGEVNDKVGR